MASIVLKSLSILLGIFFIFVGTTKLTPKISKELHKDLRKEFARYSKVFPLAQTLEFKIPSKWYRRSVGGLEVLCGICLTFIPSKRVKQGANLVLAAMMLFATYNHWMVGDKFERLAPSLVFFFMLTCRLIVEYQIHRKEKMDRVALKKSTSNMDGKDAHTSATATSATTTSGPATAFTTAANSQSPQNSIRAKKEL